MKESEKDVERYLVEQVEAVGGLCRKYVSPGVIGVPDRICLLPHGMIAFVETKSEGDTPTDHQLREHERMSDLGFFVAVVDTKAKVDHLLRYQK